MGKFFSFSSIMLGFRTISSRRSDDHVSLPLGLAMVLVPVLYELIPLFKKIILRMRGMAPPPRPRGPYAGKWETWLLGEETEAQRVERCSYIINDESLQRTTVTFEPGPMGLGLTLEGIVSLVVEEGQGAKLGIQVGWHCTQLGEERPEKVDKMQDLIAKYRSGFDPYVATFLTEPNVVAGNVAVLEQHKREEEAAAKEVADKEAAPAVEDQAAEAEKKEDNEAAGLDMGKDAAEEQDGLRRRRGEAEEQAEK